MAWGTVRFWTAGDQGDTITNLLNAQLRDKMLALDQHQHTGAAGDGNDELSAVDSITLSDMGAAASVAGRLQRNGNNLTWGASGYVITNVDDVVGTACLRTLGTGAQQAAVGNHGH